MKQDKGGQARHDVNGRARRRGGPECQFRSGCEFLRDTSPEHCAGTAGSARPPGPVLTVSGGIEQDGRDEWRDGDV